MKTAFFESQMIASKKITLADYYSTTLGHDQGEGPLARTGVPMVPHRRFEWAGELQRSAASITASIARSMPIPVMQRKSIGHSRRKQGAQGAWAVNR